MSYATHATAYREMEILSASPEQLVVILFDQLLINLRRARMAIDAGKVEMRLPPLQKSREIVSELLATLDHEKGGAIAANLSGLYAFMLGELVEQGMKPEVTRLDRVTAMVGELRDAFARIAAQRTGAPAAAAQPQAAAGYPGR